MKDNEDSSSNDEGAAEEASPGSTKDMTQEISGLLLDVVERLTKIAVICESRAAVDNSNVKSLVKHIHKFERDLRNLQEISQNARDGTNNVFSGAVRAVDNYKNPYDWAYENIIRKYESTGHNLDQALDSVDDLQKQLLERLQVNRLLDPPAKT